MVAMMTGVGGSLGVGITLGCHRMSEERAGRSRDIDLSWDMTAVARGSH